MKAIRSHQVHDVDEKVVNGQDGQCSVLAPPWDRPPCGSTAQEHKQSSPFPTPNSALSQTAQHSAFHFKAQLIRSIFYFLRGGSYGIKVGSVNSVVDESSHCFLLTFLQ